MGRYPLYVIHYSNESENEKMKTPTIIYFDKEMKKCVESHAYCSNTCMEDSIRCGYHNDVSWFRDEREPNAGSVCEFCGKHLETTPSSESFKAINPLVIELDGMTRWMISRSIEHARVEGVDVVVSLLRKQGYNQAADAVSKAFSGQESK